MIFLIIILLLIFVGYYNQSNYLDYALAFCLVLGLLSIIYTIISSFFIDISISSNNDICYRNDTKTLIFKNKYDFFPIVDIKLIIINKQLNNKKEKKLIKVRGNNFYYSIVSKECGDIEIKISNCVVKGFFGIFRINKKVNGKLNYRVYPKGTSYKEKDIKKRTIVGEGDPINKMGSDYQEIYEIRPIKSGDNLRYIHPALSNKFNNYMVKVGSETRRNIATYELVDENKFSLIIPKLEIISAIFNDLKKESSYQLYVKYKYDYYNICDTKGLLSLFDLIYEEYLD